MIANLPWSGVYGKTVGIVGLGRIGSMVATRLKAFNMGVGLDLHCGPAFRALRVEKVETLEELMRQVDFRPYTPRNEETMHMIDEKMFELAKPGIRIVNCARGGIIKEEAIIKGLESGKIASAGLDVFEKEPAENNPLFKFNNVVVTPHLGADTFEAQKRVGETIAEQVIKALRGEIVPNVTICPLLSDELNYLKPYINLAEKMGKFIINGQDSHRVELTYSGPITQNETEMLTVAFKGTVASVMEGKGQHVNARRWQMKGNSGFRAQRSAECPAL